MKIYIYGLMLLFMSSLHAEPSIEVQQLYQAAQRADAKSIENNLEWHREQNKKKPEQMLEQARDMAVAENKASVAVLLTNRLKQEQMGSWERYFRGITSVAVIGALIVAGMVYRTLSAERVGQQPQPPAQDDFTLEDLPADGDSVSPARPRAVSPVELEQAYDRSNQQSPEHVAEFAAEDFAAWKPDSAESKRN